MSDLVTIHHCRKAGLCVSGVRRHCALIGVDFRRLVKDGIPLAEVEDMEDAMVQRIISIARQEAHNG